MSESSKELERILGKNGLLAGHLDGFEFRRSQFDMALLIDQGLREERHVIIEAGTGTGKTLGYLAPLVINGKKAVVSTGTKNLQDQIFFKDIPLLSKVLGRDLDVVLMKGRRNYLCLHNFHQTFSNPDLFDRGRKALEERMRQWIEKTEFADRAELTWLPDKDPFWDMVSCPSEQCLGGRCLYFEDCFLNTLRRRAARARLIIVNHHLFFADLMVKRSGFGEIIPRFQVVVMDEAHNVEETATTYFGERLSTNQISELVLDTEKALRKPGVAADLDKKSIEKGLVGLRAAAEQIREQFQGSLERGVLDAETKDRLKKGPARDAQNELRHILENSGLDASEDPLLQAFPIRAGALLEALVAVLEANDPSWLSWYEMKKRGVVLHASPLDVSEPLKKHLFDSMDTMVLTSATLATNGDFSYIRARLGLDGDALEGIFKSHFDFETRTLLYVPKDLPLPGRPEFADRAAERIAQILEITSGRALVLFTSYHNLNRVSQYLSGKLSFKLYRQGEAPRSVLLDRFTRDVHSVLFATGSFWQGVDVPGESLSCLIVDKLPFDSPGDPLVSARIDAVRSRDGNPFMEYQVPSAIIALKQGLGRLIRSSTDSGVLAILDSRLITSRYGSHFLKSLPPMPLCHSLDALYRFFPQQCG